ncbi:MAG: hypothetical protein ABI382_10250 [Nakamurella sp.]
MRFRHTVRFGAAQSEALPATGPLAGLFTLATRKHVEPMGYTIVGDQFSNLDRG